VLFVAEPSPGTVWAVVLGLAVLSLLHFRVLRHSVFRTPSRCVLVLCSCVAASVVFLRFLVSTDPALRSSACHAAQSTTPLEFSCTGTTLADMPFIDSFCLLTTRPTTRPTTRHDTTRHDTTRHDTTRHDQRHDTTRR
jgi:hypothetical protein